MEKSVKGFKAKAAIVETESKKVLTDAVEKGRSRETSCPFRDSKDAPDPKAMLEGRKKAMKELELEYKDKLDALKDKMEKREPLFRLSEVNAAFAMQKDRAVQKKKDMTQDESERWALMRTLEESAQSRPLLIEDPHFRAEKKNKPAKEVLRDGDPASGLSASGHQVGQRIFGGRPEYEKDIKIRDAIGTTWFQNTDWAKTVREIKERADNRQQLHEIKYPNKGDGHALTRARSQHTLPSQVRPVY